MKNPVVKTKIGSEYWFLEQKKMVSGTKTDLWKGHFKNGCTERSFLKRMYTNQTSILTDVYKGLLGNGSAQDMGQIPDPCNLYHGSM